MLDLWWNVGVAYLLRKHTMRNANGKVQENLVLQYLQVLNP